jgi:HAMP domain-containing protein
VSRFRLGVRARILSIALIPTVILVAVGVGASTYLAVEAFQLRDQVSQLSAATGPTIDFVEALQEERRSSLLVLSGDRSAAPGLSTARNRVDEVIKSSELWGAQDTIAEIAPDTKGVSQRADEIAKTFTQMRQGVDAGLVPPDQAYLFYNSILDLVLVGTRGVANALPDPEAVAGAGIAVELVDVVEALSRGNALAVAVVDRMSAAQLRDYAQQVGSYHDRLTTLLPALTEAERERVTSLEGGAAWKTLSTMETAIIARGVPGDGAPLPVSVADWQSAATSVTGELLDLYHDHYAAVIDRASDNAERTATWWLVAGSALLLGVLLAALVTLRISGGLIRRLRRLRAEALSVADEHLPRIMTRLRTGADVDVTTEMVPLDFGSDEIGDVADAFNRAESAAVSAAVEEARTREGVNALFLNIAHRSQVVVHRQLELLDKAEHSEEDPNRLSVLFELDHLSTRARRNAENLIILGGEQPGRQWRVPVPLVDLVRSAVSETEDYARVHTGHMAGVAIAGSVVADLIHLIAELVDNATSNSPPESRVDITSNVVGRGAVVEIVDQGLGMSHEQIAQANQSLAQPPPLSLANLSSDSRMGLLVVSRIAARNDVTVKLTESDYGGIRAIVLIPTALIADDAPPTVLGLLAGSAAAEPPAPVANVTATVASPVAGPVATNGSTRFPPVPWPTMEPADPAPPVPLPAPAQSPEPRPARREVFLTPSSVVVPRQEPQPTAGRPTLPRRRRQENLAPQLSAPPPPRSDPAQSTGRHARPAERARDLFAEIESGTRMGRLARPDPDVYHDEGREGLR